MASKPNSTAGEDAPHLVQRLSRSLLEYVGMVVAMLAGMVVLGLLRDQVAPGLLLRADLEATVMATEMVIGMAAWMLTRRHAGRGIAVMSAVMYLPFLLLAPLFWVGAISGAVLATGGHLLMLPAMALAMPLTHRTGGQHGSARMTAARSVEAGLPSGASVQAVGVSTQDSGAPQVEGHSL